MSKVRREIDSKMEKLIKKIQKKENTKKRNKKCTFPKASKVLANKIEVYVK